MIEDLNLRLKTIKLLEGKIGGHLLNICFGDEFLDLTLKEKATKAKINKWDCIRLKSCTAKQTVNKMKRQPSEQEKKLQILYPIKC